MNSPRPTPTRAKAPATIGSGVSEPVNATATRPAASRARPTLLNLPVLTRPRMRPAIGAATAVARGAMPNISPPAIVESPRTVTR